MILVSKHVMGLLRHIFGLLRHFWLVETMLGASETLAPDRVEAIFIENLHTRGTLCEPCL